MEEYYSVKDAAKLAGITRRQLDYWVKTEIIEPAITAQRGKTGNITLFNFDNVFHLRILKAIMDAGVSTQELRNIASNMKAILMRFKQRGRSMMFTVLTQEGLLQIELATIQEELEREVAEHAERNK